MQDKWDTIESNGTLVPSIDFFLFEKLIQANYSVLEVSSYLNVFFGSSIYPKKRTKKIDLTTIVPQVELFLFFFWKN